MDEGEGDDKYNSGWGWSSGQCGGVVDLKREGANAKL